MKKILCMCLLAGSLSFASTDHKNTHSVHKKTVRSSKSAKKNAAKGSKNKHAIQQKKSTKNLKNKKVVQKEAVIDAKVAHNTVSTDTNSTQIVQKKTTTVTRGDVKVIEATENIRFLSQQIVKEYLFLFVTPQKEAVKQKVKKRLVSLSNNIRTIATTTKDVDSKDILEFLAYSKDQIAQTLSEELTEENAALMLDYSETLLEGADSIAAAHAYDFSSEERMLMTTKQMEYLIERIMKYYMAIHVGFDNPTNKSQMSQSIALFGIKLQDIEAYAYPKEINNVKNGVLKSWYANGLYLGKSDMLFIPKLMLISTANLEDLIVKIALYHNQNQ